MTIKNSEVSSEIEAVETIRLCEVDPKKNPAYSPNLYRWLRKNKVSRHRLEVYRHREEDALYIGFPDDVFFIGSRLIAVLCHGGKERQWAFPHLNRHLDKVEDFWERYKAIGRCAIDPEHSEYFASETPRYAEEKDSRTCLWCGVTQVRETYEVTIEKERWI